MTFDFTDSVVLVSGAAAGIGQRIAHRALLRIRTPRPQ
jgi:NADP-dependent 3-hydroxy acid dehydrogenase YdfG